MTEIKLSPLAYLDIVRHVIRFNHENIPEKDRQNVYGLLVGFVENGIPYITKYLPMLHSPTPIDFEMIHQIFRYADKYNTDHHDAKYISDEILGFVRSFCSENIEIGGVDKKNLLYFQTAYSDSALIFALNNSADQYSMQIKHYHGALPELDESSELEDVSWNFNEIDDLDELFKMVLQIQTNREAKAPLIKEASEK
jgi:hypothetical protein